MQATDMDTKEFTVFVEENEPTVDDYSKSVRLIDDFFKNIILPNMHKWNFCIYTERKGAGIFRDQQIRKEDLKMLPVISDSQIEEKREFIKGKSVIIFDDSIKDGDTIKEILQSVLHLSPAGVTVAVIISSKEVLDELRKSFLGVTFYAAMEVPHEEVVENHSRSIGLYLEDICLPIQEDHPVLIISFSDGKIEEIFDLFAQYGTMINDGCSFLGYIDRAKRSLLLNRDAIKSILGPIREMGLIDTDFKFEEIIIIRLYLLKGKIGKLILQPIILRDFPQNGMVSFRKTWNLVEMSILHNFLIKQLLSNTSFSEKLDIINVTFCWNKDDWWNYL